jgi:hypothetical protein
VPEILLLVGIELVDLVGGQDPVEEAEICDFTMHWVITQLITGPRTDIENGISGYT